MNRRKGFFRYASVIAVVFTITLAYVPAAQGQSVQGGGFFTLGFPKDEFGENVDNIGIGATGYVGYLFPDSPVMLGMDLGFQIYGHETRAVPLSTTIPDVTVDVTRSNNIFLWHALLRVQADEGSVQPYADGLVGLKYLWTSTSVKDDNDFFGEDVFSSKNISDFAFSYGVGGGLRFRVYENPDMRDNPFRSVLIDLQFRYLFGDEAEYVKEGDIEIDQGNVIMHVRESRTDMLLVGLGATVKFDIF